ncbi:uncharacterized protein BDR25DRAFT_309595 [Lindgomyces ingoldianus]|uniref:Uncharacterized protein n=1 Tax=Lindgomyces ingoldianus TaxID=673940 RepID=A0ACB6RDL0_9PLEO|nr:uncharacterized protein BDR25DRAFT_309595 [Lindgomyces ingoldianus]KAF2477339.1 hypothetical protein BDR25DRAFT_309595 [Lindgomyces ingoldianus]
MPLNLHRMDGYLDELRATGQNTLASADPEQLLKTHLPHVPSDLLLNQCKFQTYAKLEDVLEARDANRSEVTRHDSHHFPDRQATSVEVLQVETPSTSDEEDESDAFEMKFKRLGLRHFSASEDPSDSGQRHCNRSSNPPPSSYPQHYDISYRPTSLITPAIAHAIGDLSASESSDMDLSDADDERSAERGIKLHRHHPQKEEPYPQIPPEPSLQPVQRDGAFPDDPSTLHLDSATADLPLKHHTRARTYPLRIRPVSTHIIDATTHLQSQSQEQANIITPPCNSIQPRGSTLQVDQPRPLHLQPHPGRARPLPPTRPRPHFAPNPAPIAVPLPRRSSNPRPPVSAETDAFYKSLKSKLWKLAQELEARGDASRVSIKNDEIPSPDSDIEDMWDQEDDDVPWDDEAVDEQSLHGSDIDAVLDSLKRRSSSMGIVRRLSEGRGRRAARERAERARCNWQRGPD